MKSPSLGVPAPVNGRSLAASLMSTVCKIALIASVEDLTAKVKVFLRQGGYEFDVDESEWPAASDRENFNIGDDFPTILSLKQVTSKVSEVHFNSFGKVADLASFLSQAMGVNVVVNIYQSVSTASYWALHSAGVVKRAIEAGDGEVYSHTGGRLDFEHEEPGRPIDDEDEPFMLFDHGEQDWYNHEVGVPVGVYQEYDSSWKNFRLSRHLHKAAASTDHNRPWWKFW